MTQLESYARALDLLVNHYGWPPEEAVPFLEGRMSANDRQVGGEHYKKAGGEEHWDRAWRLKYDCFQYIITKWVERWREKGGVQDLKKAQHAIEKYIELTDVPGIAEPTPFDPIQRSGSHWVGDPPPVQWQNAQKGDIYNYGPNPLVKPDGWVGFVFEGVDNDGALFTCRMCNAKVRCPPHYSPHDFHTHAEGAKPMYQNTADPQPKGYVDQG